MSDLSFAHHRGIPVQGAFVQAAYLGGVSQTVIVLSGTSQQSSGLANNTTLIRVTSTENVYVAYGENPTATSASMLMLAGTEYFSVEPGSKIAVLQAGSGGTFQIYECL